MSADLHFPQLHRVHPRGWINDPNGIMHIDDRWHVFFQYNPEAPRHHLIRWGHMSSRDLVVWREEADGPIPQEGQPDDEGCWSGVGVPNALEGKRPHALLYSGVGGGRPHDLATVMLAEASADAGKVKQKGTVVADVPEIPGLIGVRDPFVVEAHGRRWGIQGAGIDRGHGVVAAVLLYDATDITSWRYLGPLVMGDLPAAMQHARAEIWECPQLAEIDGVWTLIVSLWFRAGHLPDGAVDRGGPTSVAYLRGQLELVPEAERAGLFPEELQGDLTGDALRFVPEGGGAVDVGPDFYAPQAVHDPQRDRGRTVLWGWSWEGAELTQEQIDAKGWAGVLTFPRRLSWADGGVLRSRPVRELALLRGSSLEPRRTAEGSLLDLPRRVELQIEGPFSLHRIARDRSETLILDKPELQGRSTVLIDASIIEIFPENEPAHTQRVYIAEKERLRVRTGAEGSLRGWRLRRPGAGS